MCVKSGGVFSLISVNNRQVAGACDQLSLSGIFGLLFLMAREAVGANG